MAAQNKAWPRFLLTCEPSAAMRRPLRIFSQPHRSNPNDCNVRMQLLLCGFALAALLFVLQACGSISRIPLSAIDEAHIPGIPNARYWADDISRAAPIVAAR